MDRPSITFVVPGINARPGGGVRIIFEYANRLAMRGYRVQIIHLGDFTLRSLRLPRPFKHAIVRLGFIRGISWFKFDASIIHILTFIGEEHKTLKADYVCATAAVTASYVNSLPAVCGKKLYLIQDYESWDMSDQDLSLTYQFGMRNIAISHWLEDTVRNLSGQCDCIPNPIDTNVFYPEKGGCREEKTVAVMYSSKPHKGFVDAWAALEIVHDQIPELRVAMFGAERSPAWLPNWVTYSENASDVKLRSIYNKSSVYVCASRREGFALTCVEAMACGCALVVTDFAGSREYARSGHNSIVVEVGKVDAIASGILCLLENDDLRNKFAAQGLSDAKVRTWNSAVDKFETILNELGR